MSSVDLKHPVSRALPFRLFVCACLGFEAVVHLYNSRTLSALLICLWLLLWAVLSIAAKRWDRDATALLLHISEAAFLPSLLASIGDELAAGPLLIALAGAAALGGWRFLLPSAAVMSVTLSVLPDFPQPPHLAAVLFAGFVVPLALYSFGVAQRLHLQGNAARDRSAALGQANAFLEKYLPEPVRERARRGISNRQLPSTCWVSVVFIDLVGFTSYVRSRPSAEIMTVINDFQSAISAQVAAADGVLGKFLGDGALVYFPQRCSRREEALKSLKLAQVLPALAVRLNTRWRQDGYLTRLQVRSGIASGYCALGDWGGEERGRLDHCIIGDCVNLASRLQQAADPGGTLACEVTAALIEGSVESPSERSNFLGDCCYRELKGLGPTPAYPLVDAASGPL